MLMLRVTHWIRLKYFKMNLFMYWGYYNRAFLVKVQSCDIRYQFWLFMVELSAPIKVKRVYSSSCWGPTCYPFYPRSKKHCNELKVYNAESDLRFIILVTFYYHRHHLKMHILNFILIFTPQKKKKLRS